jgi:hypothetical protein
LDRPGLEYILELFQCRLRKVRKKIRQEKKQKGIMKGGTKEIMHEEQKN